MPAVASGVNRRPAGSDAMRARCSSEPAGNGSCSTGYASTSASATTASSSRSRWATPAARLPPALAPPIAHARTTRQQLGVAGRPDERRMDVVVGHREVDATVAQPVVDRDDDGAGPLGDLPGDDIGLGHLQVAEHERSAVGPEEPAAGVIAGAVDPHGHLAVWAGGDGAHRSRTSGAT